MSPHSAAAIARIDSDTVFSSVCVYSSTPLWTVQDISRSLVITLWLKARKKSKIMAKGQRSWPLRTKMWKVLGGYLRHEWIDLR